MIKIDKPAFEKALAALLAAMEGSSEGMATPLHYAIQAYEEAKWRPFSELRNPDHDGYELLLRSVDGFDQGEKEWLTYVGKIWFLDGEMHAEIFNYGEDFVDEPVTMKLVADGMFSDWQPLPQQFYEDEQTP